MHPAKLIPAVTEFVDIAGLVKGASQGEGLGNKFLSHIRECDAIAQVVRIFEDSNITHVHGTVDPNRDREVIESELILADLQSIEKRLPKWDKESRGGNKESQQLLGMGQKLMEEMNQGKLASQLDWTDEERELLKQFQLLTSKPMMFIVNVHEDEITQFDEAMVRDQLGIHAQHKIIPISAKIEQELGQLSEEEAKEFLADIGLKEPGMHSLIRHAYDILGLQTYFTAGVKEVRAWTVKKGASAPQAAGVIHTDFEKGFIRAEVIPFEKFVEHGGEHGAKEKGHMRLEGKEYLVKDGDVMHFRFAN
ncbi:MAG: GTP-binding protein YchF [Candidatus Peregrinibacteria bacterium GW2011_GWA2_44_7]|nr:MAG: GTP-binding protein YchF [Candidatus Peregrinibacteria bacterium GW2011_GWA2_44_7]